MRCFAHPNPAILFAVALSLSACANAAPTPVTPAPAASIEPLGLLSGDAIRSALSGQRLQWVRARDQASGQTDFLPDGAMRWSRFDVQANGRGRWSVEGDRLCQTYDPTPTWKGGRVCRTLTRRPDGELYTSSNDGGRVTYTAIRGGTS
ncbi:MAG: hypothetical protein AAFZ01_02930 [Pseudomonadota bacterium]